MQWGGCVRLVEHHRLVHWWKLMTSKSTRWLQLNWMTSVNWMHMMVVELTVGSKEWSLLARVSAYLA